MEPKKAMIYGYAMLPWCFPVLPSKCRKIGCEML